MSARPIGEILAPIIENARSLARLQEKLMELPTRAERKRDILTLRGLEAISDDDCSLLISAMMLEDA